MLRMDECNKIRKDYQQKQLSIYEIAKKYNRSWDTINRIVHASEEDLANRGKRPHRNKKVLTQEITDKINEYLDFEVDHKVPKKQKFTAKYIYETLVQEGVYQGAERTFRKEVARLRKERLLKKEKTYLKLDFEFGNFIQVDHGPVLVEIGGHKIDGYLFVASVPKATLRYCQFYPMKSTEAWGDFHEKMFTYFGGVFENCIYDNDSVLKINKTDEETLFCHQLQSHYNFRSIFCNKGAGWEKGSVENAVGFCRRNYLSGLKSFDNFNHLNEYLESKCLESTVNGRHYGSKRPLIELFDDLKNHLSKKPGIKNWGILLDLKVDSYQQVRIANHYYSVPEKYVGSKLQCFKSSWEIEIFINNERILKHPRCHLPAEDSLVLDHYLNQLLKKPRAFDSTKVVKESAFSIELQKLKTKLRAKFSPYLANKEFIKILILKRKASETDFKLAIELALKFNSISCSGVRSIIQQLQIKQIREIDRPEFPNIDNHFDLSKFQELEIRSYCD